MVLPLFALLQTPQKQNLVPVNLLSIQLFAGISGSTWSQSGQHTINGVGVPWTV
jgi:hypothetical protein